MDDLIENSYGPIEAGDGVALTRAGRREQQTQRILEAAKACFIRSGFKGASMHDICAEAGMSPGALYRYFPSKEAIVEAICEADRREDAVLFAKVLQEPDVIEGLVMGAMAHIRHMHENDNAALFAEICAEAMRNDAVETTCMKNMVEVQAMFANYIGGARERGEIDPPVELDVLLPTLMSIAHGMALNDLPAMGVPYEKLEVLLRAMVVGMLRPTERPENA
ncbi:TetR/AcrR family transcriptional regulator [Mesorhizobium sp. LHD-90]|uniref:TetR/AcrR family transcriptional regulator n=1 Tax=Mesorhizobium sp. LHD-90 TaxID=3071414 RepID=UPI0027E11FF5|nr:TetR/AcrR family transcriptional regulator [Mesorhizobium sp. LHD-90]MDQ6434492.1 TetR/AcrR family transcriptional regulator [Mesorhizobium sp. LHD-90]